MRYVLAVLLCAVAVTSDPAVEVLTKEGVVVGTKSQWTMSFRGIPYAQPPVGPLRWKDPVPATPWSKPRPAFTLDVGCPQVCIDGVTLPTGGCPPRVSEDCLYLNVFAPVGAKNAAVMAWIHGGQFKWGYSGGHVYDGTSLANTTGVIVVTINYRLGPLGFLATGGDGDIHGNYGILDQRLALQWIQQNIESFGGDPARVTLFGQSAGAMSTATHVVLPKSKGLFSQVIVESEPFGLPFRTVKSFHSFAKKVNEAAGCAKVDDACLKKLTFQQIVNASASVEKKIGPELFHLLSLFMPWSPVIDPNGEITQTVIDSWRTGEVASKVPAMIGSVKQEGTLFVYEAFTKPVSIVEGDVLVTAFFGASNILEIKRQYKWTNKSDARDVVAQITTDSLFACAARNASNARALQALPTWVYEYDHPWSFARTGWGPTWKECWDISCHASEIPFVFLPNGTQTIFNATFTPAELELGFAMQEYWSSFAKHGFPGTGNPLHQLQWGEFKSKQTTEERSMHLTTPPVMQNNRWSFVCEMWDKIGYDFLGGL